MVSEHKTRKIKMQSNEKWVKVGESPSGSRLYYVSNLGRL